MKFEEAKKMECACIYKLSYPNGKCYIGQTKCLRDRIRLYESQLSGKLVCDSKNLSALSEFGIDNVDVSVVCEISTSAIDDVVLCLSILEIKYIREFDSIFPNGYNSGIGGELLGIPVDDISTSGNSCQVLVYDNMGDFQKSYPSKAMCCYDLGILEKELPRYIDKAKIYKGKYIFRAGRYGYIPKHIESTGFKVVSQIRTVVQKRVVKRVVKKEYVAHVVPHALKYNEFGDFCGEYDSKNKAALSFCNSHSVPYGKYVNGYILYKKVSDDYPIKIEPYEATIGKVLGDVYKPMTECEDKPVSNLSKGRYEKKGKLLNDFEIGQYDIHGNLIAKYDGIRSASKSTGVRYSCIWQNIKGVTRIGGGYVWRKI